MSVADNSSVPHQSLVHLLTIKEAAAACRMSEGWIRSAIRDGELQVVRFGKVRGVRIREEDLQDYIRRKIEGTTSSFNRAMAAYTEMKQSLNEKVTLRD